LAIIQCLSFERLVPGEFMLLMAQSGRAPSLTAMSAFEGKADVDQAPTSRPLLTRTGHRL
jgi:hypothetical protein